MLTFKAEFASSLNNNEGLTERMSRFDAYTEKITSSVNGLQNELSGAQVDVEARFHQQRSEHIKSMIDSVKKDYNSSKR